MKIYNLNKMWYVYIISSKNEDWKYVGYTQDLKKRFSDHNKGKNKATKPYVPFSLTAYVAVETEELARNLEKYFKGGSGRAWYNKRLIASEKTG